jgi:hypothetical protein
MTDAELRGWCKGVLGGDPNTRLATGFEHDVQMAKIAARRLIELLPPADDGDAVTAEWLKAVGFLNEDEDEPTFYTVLFDDLYPAFTIDVDPASTKHAGWIGEAEDNVSWPHDICGRGQVRDICRALGITLQEPTQ